MSDDSSLKSPDYSINRPGQTTIFYRATTHGQSLARMKARLAKQTIASGPWKGTRPLAALTTLAESEPTVALLDAWSAVLDVLTFYQERAAHEGYLRTATETLSVRCLAQGLGYRPQPAISASTYLAFVVDDSATMPTQVAIPSGAQVMSVPVGAALPQTYETSTDLTARVTWNQLLPRLFQPQTLVTSNQAAAGTAVSTLRLAGLSTGLLVGSLLRIADTTTLQVTEVTRKPSEQLTEVSFQVVDGPAVRIAPVATLPMGDPSKLPSLLSESAVSEHILGRTWDDAMLTECITTRGWDESKLTRITASLLAAKTTASLVTYRQQTAFFGANAPPWSAMPKIDSAYLRGTDLYADSSSSWDETSTTTGSKLARNKRSIWEDSWGQLYSATTDCDVYLDQAISGVVAGSSVLLVGSAGYRSFVIGSLSHTTVRGYGTTARSTGLKLSLSTQALAAAQSVRFLTRDSVLHMQSESLDLTATVPRIDTSSVRDSVELSGLVLGLAVGQPVLVSGEHASQSGVSSSEIARLAQILHKGGYTTLRFSAPLAVERIRSTVSICANVVTATHGKTVASEVLGSGDASQKNQRFALKQSPLTYLPDASAAGAKSTLSVRVGGVLWLEVDSLLGEDGRSRCYVIEHSASGQVTVVFGDGEHGARLPSGQDNVVASYRVGGGLDGEVAAGSLQILLTRPLGLRSVKHPVAASGASAGSSQAELKETLPLSVATLGRAVSLLDYETMAKNYPGIAKAQATSVRSAGVVAVHLTVATDDGEPLARSSLLYAGLQSALLSLGEPTQPLILDDYQPRRFAVSIRIALDPRYDATSVKAQVDAQLQEAFSFAARSFAQPVRAAEVLDLVQRVPGVTGALLDGLWLIGEPRSRRQLLVAAPARIDRGGRSVGAEILLLSLEDDSVGVLP